eukprot:SAG31_NODE_25395_length_462_cov_0.867769_1_plen_137_part_01
MLLGLLRAYVPAWLMLMAHRACAPLPPWMLWYWGTMACVVFVALSLADHFIWRKCRQWGPTIGEATDVNPLVSSTWRITTAERAKLAIIGPILVPIRIVLLLIFTLLAVLFSKLALVGFKDNRKQVTPTTSSAPHHI